MPVVGFIAMFLSAVLSGCAAPQRPAGSGPNALAAAAGMEYTVSLPEPQTQMVDVAILVRDVESETVDFVLPAWRPGRYAILDQAGGVREVRAAAAEGIALRVHKPDKTTWRVDTDGSRDVTLTYRVYANSLGERTRHVDDTHAFLDATAVLLYVPDRRSRPVTVAVAAPEGWQVATGLEPDPDHPNTFSAPDYDTLADSPLEVGLHESIRFDVDGAPHEVALWGRQNAARHNIAADFAKIIRAQRDVFGDLPFRRYVFIIHCAPGARGATEHLNSTVVQASPTVFDTAKSYRGFLGLISHEFFHSWNVKQFRPSGLHPYDYLHENYTTSLWIAEGTTSYYGPLTLARTGLVEVKEYLEQQAAAIGSVLNRPGRSVQSLEESSFDAWIKFSRSSPDSVNSTVSFYEKGALVSLLLDMELRRRTANRITLDDAMRAMYREFPLTGPGYTPDDFRAVVERLSGDAFSSFFAAYTAGTAELPLADALSVAGLDLTFKPDKDAAKDGKPDPAAYIGLDLSDRNGIATVDAVRADGPAYSAGVIAGDEIVALNGVRLRAAELGDHLDLLAPGDTVRLTLFRRDDLREIEFTASGKPRGKWTLTRSKSPTDAQRAVYESWLKQPWPEEAAKEAEDSDEPESP